MELRPGRLGKQATNLHVRVFADSGVENLDWVVGFQSQTGDGPINLVDALLGPGPMREMIENFSAVGWMFLRRMPREVTDSGPDERLQELLERADADVKDVPVDVENPGSEFVVCTHLRTGDQVIKTVSKVARFGTPMLCDRHWWAGWDSNPGHSD